MRDWSIMLGALACWALHFMLIYGFASIADVSGPATIRLWSWLGLAATVLALLALAWIALEARSKRTQSDLTRHLGLGGCVVSGVGILLQSLPLFVAG